MFIADKTYQFAGRLPAPGMIFRVKDPRYDKDNLVFHCLLTGYANEKDYQAKDAWKDFYNVHIYHPSVAPKHVHTMHHHNDLQELHYVLEDVIRCGGGVPENPTIPADTWSDNIYGQAYLLLGVLEEFKKFVSDETKTKK